MMTAIFTCENTINSILPILSHISLPWQQGLSEECIWARNVSQIPSWWNL